MLLVCKLFRAHEMCSQLEKLEPSFHRNTLLHRTCGLYAWKWGLESVYYCHLRGEGGRVLIKELHNSHVGRACNDCNGTTICIYHEQKTLA